MLLPRFFLFCLIFSGQVGEKALAWLILPEYIHNLSVSPSPFDPSGDSDASEGADFWNPPEIAKMTISYDQDLNGYVLIKVYPYAVDEDGNQYIVFERPITIFASLLEIAGSKTVSWPGMDEDGNIVEEGRYMLEAQLYSDFNYQDAKGIPSTADLEILYHLNQ